MRWAQMNNAQENFRYAQVMRSFMDDRIARQEAIKNNLAQKMWRLSKERKGERNEAY